MEARGPNRLLAIGLALAAAACLSYAAFSKQWLVNDSAYSHVGFGLRSTEGCQTFGDELSCEASTSTWEKARVFMPSDMSSAFVPTGWATFVACLAGAAGLAAAAAIAIARKRPDLPINPTTIALLALMAGLITGCVFIATKPGPAGYIGAGIGFWVFAAGAVLGIAGAQMLAKVNRPIDPDLMEDAMNPEQF